jgi:hypothetical protein
MKKLTFVVLMLAVGSAWAGLGDLGKLKGALDKKDKDKKDEAKKDQAAEEKSSDSGQAGGDVAEPTAPINKPEDVDQGGDEKNAWSDAQVGWMVKSKGFNNMVTMMEVVEVKDRVLLVKTTTIMNDKPAAKMLMYLPRFSKPAQADEKTPKADVKVTDLPDETIKVAGKDLVCKVRQTESTQDGKKVTTIIWTNEEVPGKSVRVKSDSMGQMQVISEVIDFKK